MNSFRSFFDILQVSRFADEKTIEDVYRSLAKRYHPDVNKAPNADALMREINKAYEVLRNPIKREHYRKTLEFIEKEDFEAAARRIGEQIAAEQKLKESSSSQKPPESIKITQARHKIFNHKALIVIAALILFAWILRGGPEHIDGFATVNGVSSIISHGSTNLFYVSNPRVIKTSIAESREIKRYIAEFDSLNQELSSMDSRISALQKEFNNRLTPEIAPKLRSISQEFYIIYIKILSLKPPGRYVGFNNKFSVYIYELANHNSVLADYAQNRNASSLSIVNEVERKINAAFVAAIEELAEIEQ